MKKLNNYIIRLGLFSSLVMSSFSYGYFGYSEDLPQQLGEFEGSVLFDELEDHQVTSANYAEVVIRHSTGSEVVIMQKNTGAGANKAKIVQNNTTDSTATIAQKGSSNTALIEQADGNYNFAKISQAGIGHKGYINQVGSNNVAVISQCVFNPLGCSYTSNSSELGINQYGDNNLAAIYDSGRSSYSVTQSGGDKILVVSDMNRGIYIKQ